MLATPAFHQMVEVVDLTLSEDDDEVADTVEPTYAVLASLPLRERSANISFRHCPGKGERLKKRSREDTPHPRVGLQHSKKRCRQQQGKEEQYPYGVLKPVCLAGSVRK